MTQSKTIQLGQIATVRSGDKGNHANLGVAAFSETGFEYLQQYLTAERVNDFFRRLGAEKIERFELPKVWAFNFLLYNVLSGGASQSLRIDTQGKLLGTAAMEIELPAPDELSTMTKPRN